MGGYLSASMRLSELVGEYAVVARLAVRTVDRMRHDVARFKRLTVDAVENVRTIDAGTFAAFRLGAGHLSPRTVESTVDTVLTLLRFVAETRPHELPAVPSAGRRLRRGSPVPDVLSITDLDKAFGSRGVAVWPSRTGRPCGGRKASWWLGSTDEFWSVFFCLAYFTGGRLGDLVELRWSDIDGDAGVIGFGSSKTRKRHRLPYHPICRHWVEPLRQGATDRVLPMGRSSRHLLRREIRRISTAAGIRKPLGPQELRKVSAMAHELAHPGSAATLLGHALPSSSTKFYLDGFAVLTSASRRLAVPRSMIPDGMDPADTVHADELVDKFSRLSPRDRDVLLTMADTLTG